VLAAPVELRFGIHILLGALFFFGRAAQMAAWANDYLSVLPANEQGQVPQP